MIIIQKKLNSQLLSPLITFVIVGFQMDILTKISGKIDHLNTGEQWSIRAQDLWISRADFQSLSMYLSKEAEKGKFSIQSNDTFSPRLGGTELIVTKH